MRATRVNLITYKLVQSVVVQLSLAFASRCTLNCSHAKIPCTGSPCQRCLELMIYSWVTGQVHRRWRLLKGGIGHLNCLPCEHFVVITMVLRSDTHGIVSWPLNELAISTDDFVLLFHLWYQASYSSQLGILSISQTRGYVLVTPAVTGKGSAQA